MNPEFSKIIEMNQKLNKAYFYTPPQNASARRSYEKKYSAEYSETINNVKFFAESRTKCSCKNIYHHAIYLINDIVVNKTKFISFMEKIENNERICKKDRIRFFKQLGVEKNE